ncbi:MAG: sulfur carrier protein ThiS [Polaromonas sp.]|nr:sulfur carrier protein ThiS [Polaromonas sp.]
MKPETTLNISLNAQPVTTRATTLQALLLDQGYKFENAFACAINNGFVPRTQWAGRVLAHGDRIDVITPIAGG